MKAAAHAETRPPRLRPYQQDAHDALREYLRTRKGRGPVVVAPTASGKAHLIAEVAAGAARKAKQVLVLTHRRELLKQNREKLVAARPDLELLSCFYSAGLAEKRLDRPVVFAGIQSLCRVPGELPAFDVVLIDEAHWVPPLDRDSMYARVIHAIRERNPRAVFVGYTATPYRTGEGYLWDSNHAVWSGAAYEIAMHELIEDGYLCPLTTEVPASQIDISRLVKNRKGEFSERSLQEATAPLVREIAQGALAQFEAERRRGMMVFTPTLDLVDLFVEAFDALGVPCEDVVSVRGDDPSKERDDALEAFKAQRARIIVSCGVLTEGFDATHADLIVVARAMASPGLWVQICGRGMRLHRGKRDCVIRDHGSNFERLGPVNAVVPTRFQPGKGRKNKDGEQEGGGGEGERTVRLTLDPSRSRAMVTRDKREEATFQAVTHRDCQARTFSSGNRGITLTLTLAGKPARVWESFVVGKGKRSFAGKRFSRIFGTPMPGNEHDALEAARKRMEGIRRVAVEMEKSWPKVRHIERDAYTAEERRQSEGGPHN